MVVSSAVFFQRYYHGQRSIFKDTTMDNIDDTTMEFMHIDPRFFGIILLFYFISWCFPLFYEFETWRITYLACRAPVCVFHHIQSNHVHRDIINNVHRGIINLHRSINKSLPSPLWGENCVTHHIYVFTKIHTTYSPP